MTSAADTLETLLLPFNSGVLAWPTQGKVLFMRARTGAALNDAPQGILVCAQSFKPWVDALKMDGHAIEGDVALSSEDQGFPIVLLLPPRQREEARALLAEALQRVAPGGVVVAAMANNEGARTGEADLGRLAGSVQSLSKNKCRVFWAAADARCDVALINEWVILDAPRSIMDGRFLTRPGLFSWSHIDIASALLARCLPSRLAGVGADLGSGFGYLAAEVLERCAGVTAFDLYEAEARGLELARLNLADHAKRIPVDFIWHDVTGGLLEGRRYDFIVSNPPFHHGRADQPEIGQAFIFASANALVPGGRFWLVANRHLPYEEVLNRNFRKVRSVCVEQGFKVIEAIK